MPEEYLELLKKNNVEYTETSELDKAVPDVDVLYMTRIQQERFENPEEYNKLKGTYVLTPDIVKLGKPDLRVLHPLPRVDEITVEVDGMDQAAYFRQAENGIYMRMALLKTLWSNYNK